MPLEAETARTPGNKAISSAVVRGYYRLGHMKMELKQKLWKTLELKPLKADLRESWLTPKCSEYMSCLSMKVIQKRLQQKKRKMPKN